MSRSLSRSSREEPDLLLAVAHAERLALVPLPRPGDGMDAAQWTCRSTPTLGYLAVKVGLIARSEDRGLGNLTWEWAQHMHPDRVLVVVPNHAARQRLDRYPGATVLRWNHRGNGTLDEQVVREWLDGLDIVYTAETFYDWRVCDWARDMNVRTVCHVMPEYFRHHGIGGRDLPVPDVWWTPTRWRFDQLARGTRVVPVPVALERFMDHEPWTMHSPPKWLHIAGVVASGDRNGSAVVREALPMLKREHVFRIRALTGIPRPRAGRLVTVELVTRPASEYWQLYGDADGLVSPRRYAGLSLPAMEAMAAGLALVMTDCEPQRSEWPIIGLPAETAGSVTVAGGTIPLVNVAPEVLAARLDWLADHPEEIASAKRRARKFAESMAWDRLAPQIHVELERACR